MTEAHRTEDPTIPRVGDIWKECDPRFERYVRIESVNPGRRGVAIITVVGSEVRWMVKPRCRVTYADLERFNGKRTGYKLHQRRPQ